MSSTSKPYHTITVSAHNRRGFSVHGHFYDAGRMAAYVARLEGARPDLTVVPVTIGDPTIKDVNRIWPMKAPRLVATAQMPVPGGEIHRYELLFEGGDDGLPYAVYCILPGGQRIPAARMATPLTAWRMLVDADNKVVDWKSAKE